MYVYKRYYNEKKLSWIYITEVSVIIFLGVIVIGKNLNIDYLYTFKNNTFLFDRGLAFRGFCKYVNQLVNKLIINLSFKVTFIDKQPFSFS